MGCTSWAVDQIFCQAEFAQGAVSDFFLSFYVFNFGVVFFMHI
jgi:hypothetical protein